MSKTGAIGTFESNSSAEAILVSIAALLSQNGVLPALLAGLVLAGILASTMSTADAQLLAAASSISHIFPLIIFNFLERAIRRGALPSNTSAEQFSSIVS